MSSALTKSIKKNLSVTKQETTVQKVTCLTNVPTSVAIIELETEPILELGQNSGVRSDLEFSEIGHHSPVVYVGSFRVFVWLGL